MAEDARSSLAARLEALALQQEQFLVVFGKEDDRVVELELTARFLGPRCLFIKQVHTSAKVSRVSP